MLAGAFCGLAGPEVLRASVTAAGASGFLLVAGIRAGAKTYRRGDGLSRLIRPWLLLSAMR